MKTIYAPLSLAFAILSSAVIPATAVNNYPDPGPDEKEAFVVSFSKALWTPDGEQYEFANLYDRLVSTEKFADQFWQFENASLSNQSYIGIGSPYYDVTATLTGEAPIPEQISLISLYLNTNPKADMSNILDLCVLVADNPEMEGATEIYSSDPIEHDSFMNFRIEDPGTDRYYGLRLKSSTYDPTVTEKELIYVRSLTFFSLDPEASLTLPESDSDAYGADSRTHYYDLQGHELVGPAPGLTIIRSGARTTKSLRP